MGSTGRWLLHHLPHKHEGQNSDPRNSCKMPSGSLIIPAPVGEGSAEQVGLAPEQWALGSTEGPFLRE